MRLLHRHHCSCVWAFLFSMQFAHYLFYEKMIVFSDFFTSLIILSNFSFISFLNSAISLFALSVTLCVHTCNYVSFCVGLIRTAPLSVTELRISKLLRVSIIVSLPCEAPASEALRSLSSEGDSPCLVLLLLLFSISIRLKQCLLEKEFQLGRGVN